MNDHSLNHVLEHIQRMEGAILGKLNKIMAILDDLTLQVKANTDAEASAVQLLQNLHDLLVNAGTDPAKLQAIKDTLKSSADALAAAVVANTPAA